MHMKTLLISILMAVLILPAYGTAPQNKKKRLTREQKKQMKIEMVEKFIQKDSIVIQIDKIRPSYALDVNNNSYFGYTGQKLKLADGKFSVNLTYLGELAKAMIGTEDITLYTQNQDVKPVKNKDSKKLITNYYFTFVNESRNNTALWECFIEIQQTGEVLVTMQTKDKNPMLYIGFLDIEDIYGNK